MKSVTLTFVGDRSDEVAKKFYSWVVDGGLEDQIIDTLSGGGVAVTGIIDHDSAQLSIAIGSKLE